MVTIPGLRGELEDTVGSLKDHGFRHILNNQRAQSFYSKWLSQYGDDSIAQVTGTHVIAWGISQVAMKYVEDQRVGLEPIEKSTRYVNFGSKVAGRYLYYVPKPGSYPPRFIGRIPRRYGPSVRHLRRAASSFAGLVEGKISGKKTPSWRRKHSIPFAVSCRWRRSVRSPFGETRRPLNT